jgi:CelD/BcsL family acetyltransferase involved in cellulose biosynthesis
MTVWWIDPLSDRRWADLVDKHPHASVFHTRGWLETLSRTYHYEPIAVTTTPPDRPLLNAIVFCRIESWVTGRRLVSLPFSDHCDLMVDNTGETDELITAAIAAQEGGRWKYVELRPLDVPPADPRLTEDDAYCLHRLDLRPDSNVLFARFHKNHVRRKIRRGERAALEYREGSSQDLVGAFYKLLLKTRSRHGLPPQPLRWFQTIFECFGNAASVRLTFKDGTPAAGMVTLRHRSTIVYKYGASDERFHPLGAVQCLFWRTIQDARLSGCTTFDFGRSATTNTGLVAFKDHWGAVRSKLAYRRFPSPRASEAVQRIGTRLGQRLVSHLPDRALVAIGRAMYRHIG